VCVSCECVCVCVCVCVRVHREGHTVFVRMCVSHTCVQARARALCGHNCLCVCVTVQVLGCVHMRHGLTIGVQPHTAIATTRMIQSHHTCSKVGCCCKPVNEKLPVTPLLVLVWALLWGLVKPLALMQF